MKNKRQKLNQIQVAWCKLSLKQQQELLISYEESDNELNLMDHETVTNQILDYRLKHLEEHPDSLRDWEKVKKELDKKYNV